MTPYYFFLFHLKQRMLCQLPLLPTSSSVFLPCPVSLLEPLVFVVSSFVYLCPLFSKIYPEVNQASLQKPLQLMAERTSRCLFFFLFLLFSFSIYCSGTPTRSRGSLIVKTVSTLKLNKGFPSQIQVTVSDHRVLGTLSITGVSVDVYLTQTQFGNRKSYKASLILSLKIHLRPVVTKLDVRSVIISSSIGNFSQGDELQTRLPILKTAYSLLNGLQLEKPVKLSISFPLPLLQSLNMKQKRDVDRILHFLRKTKSFVTVEDCSDGGLSIADGFVQALISKASMATSLLSHVDVPIVLSIRSSRFLNATEVSALIDKILRSLDFHYEIAGTIIGILLEVSPVHRLQLLGSSHRELLASFDHQATTKHDSFDPPTTSFPTSPFTNPTTMPSDLPPFGPTPTIITIPATNPVSVTPTNPTVVPLTNPVPSTTPIPITPTNPSTNPAAPLSYPGAQPVTNPVTTYPSPVGGVPVTSPVTTPVTSPGGTNAPLIGGQTWCVARSGVVEAALQGALDYACGIGEADCSMIQEGASCYNPNTLENHASYAFNSYFQKNPVASSCDFGGTAVLVNTNPSYASCIYPSSAATSVPSTVSPATTTSSSGATGTVFSYGTPPSIPFTSSNPNPGSSTGYGSEFPPIITAPSSWSASVQPFLGIITLITSVTLGALLEMW